MFHFIFNIFQIMSSEFVQKLDKRDEEVLKGFEVFEKFYGNAFRRTSVSQIIDGENIALKPENIRIDEPVDESIVNVKQVDEIFAKCCTKKPYEYQRQAVLKILELENKQEHINPVDNTTIVSNGYQLALPIGSGKSLIFEFLALFYQTVPIHPIIVSTDGRHIPNDQLPFDNYPFYYENSSYCKETANAVMAIKTDLQRKCTVILTHRHLLGQLRKYFKDDFIKPILTNKSYQIKYYDTNQLETIPNLEQDIANIAILVVVADKSNVEKLIELSYTKPFARVIIDDYTNMRDLSNLRQILTFSFIPVSGSGFDKAISQIPSSYYSLKNINTEAIKLVGDPHKTYEGVMRSNILTGEILSTSSDFDVYSFVTTVEEMIRRLPGCEKETPASLFKEFETASTIDLFIKYGFFVQNITTFKRMIPMLLIDIQHDKIPLDKISHFIKWYNETEDDKFKNLICTPNSGNVNKSYPTLLNSKCVICHETKDLTYGFGCISSCCGAFICSKCIEQAATTTIVDNVDLKQMEDNENYYCVCCRAKNPKYFFNSTQHSASNETRSFTFAQRYFVNNCEEHFSIDYYFEMLLNNGWSMKRSSCKGKSLNIRNDIETGLIPANVFEIKKIPVIEKLKNSDLLFPQVLTAIYKTYAQLGIKPAKNSIFLVYKCKPIIQQRMQEQFDQLRYVEDPKTKLQVLNEESPFYDSRLIFQETVGSVIGLSINLAGIVVYNPDEDEAYSMLQLFGRILRISTYNQKILFYVSNNTHAYN